MDLKILNKKENPLLQREDIEFEVDNAKTTPSIKDLREQISASTGSKKELVMVRIAKPVYGKHKILGNAKVYESEEIMKRVELEYVIRRNEGKKKEAEKKEESAPAEGKQEKKPDAEKTPAKEEVKPENKSKEPAKEKANEEK